MKAGAVLCAAVLSTLTAAAESHDQAFSRDGLLKADAADLKDTRLVAHPDAPLKPNDNLLWCGTMQLTWNEAIKLVGEKLQFNRPSPLARQLNREDFTAADLDPSSYVAVADFERNNVEDKIRAALQKTFHGDASPELIPSKPPNPGPDDFVAYSYLYKNLAFVQPFIDGTMNFEGEPVQEFGFGSDADVRLMGQVKIDDYQSRDDFIIELETESSQDELILAKVAPGATLAATIKAVLARIAAKQPMPPGEDDELSVPKLNFDLRRDFGELEGLVLQPTPAARIQNKLVISKAEQLVRFQLNEKGAVLKSEATMVMVAMARAPAPHHELIFDKPFLILLKQAASQQPYFALWVGNTTLLVKAKSP